MVDLGELYRSTGDIPWVVGLSGGKDSTALTMYLLETMEQLPPPIRNQKKVIITCVNTLVEAPPVIDHVHTFIERLRLYIQDRGLPVEVVMLVPEFEQTFWSNVIGRGVSFNKAVTFDKSVSSDQFTLTVYKDSSLAVSETSSSSFCVVIAVVSGFKGSILYFFMPVSTIPFRKSFTAGHPGST